MSIWGTIISQVKPKTNAMKANSAATKVTKSFRL
jgi:hypothetical protein